MLNGVKEVPEEVVSRNPVTLKEGLMELDSLLVDIASFLEVGESPEATSEDTLIGRLDIAIDVMKQRAAAIYAEVGRLAPREC